MDSLPLPSELLELALPAATWADRPRGVDEGEAQAQPWAQWLDGLCELYPHCPVHGELTLRAFRLLLGRL
jgi:hypothetical protein